MIVPGSNLLATALTLIAAQTVGYRRFKNSEVNAAGDKVAAYHPTVPKRGSFQPVERRLFTQYGLDYTKEYANWYDPAAEASTVERGKGADQIIYGGADWEAVDATNWKRPDGWRGTLFVNIGRAQCCK